MRIKPVSFIPIFLLLLMLYVIIESLSYDYLQAKLLPLIVGSAVFILAALQLSRELQSKEMKAATEPTPQTETKSLLCRLGVALGWVVGFFLSIYLVGFFIAIELFLIAYLKVHGRGWIRAICVATLLNAAIYGIFEIGFKFHLYWGLIFS